MASIKKHALCQVLYCLACTYITFTSIYSVFNTINSSPWKYFLELFLVFLLLYPFNQSILQQKKRLISMILWYYFLVLYCSRLLISVARRREAVVSLVKENSVLRGHVIMPLQAESELFCALLCLNTRNCFSFNYKTNRQVCELNHTNTFTSPNDFILDLDSTYYEMVFT